MRDSNTERIGIYKAGFIFTKEIKWIFREQPIVDVGIDALIEQSIDGNPTGQFIAAQIKTGEGNFYINKTHLTHGVSKIHYNYWLNFNVPVILIAHLPNQDETYWEAITKTTLKKTKTRWKLSISKDKKLNSHSLNELNSLIKLDIIKDSKSDKYHFSRHRISKSNNFFLRIKDKGISDNEFQKIVHESLSIGISALSLSNINSLIESLGKKTIENRKMIEHYAKLELTEFDKRVKRSVKKFSEFIDIISLKLSKEINHFAEHYACGIHSYEKIALLNFHIHKNYKELQNTSNELTSLTSAIKEGIKGIKILRNSISDLPPKYSNLKKAKIKFTDTSDDIIDELKVAISLNQKFVKGLEEILK